MIAYRVRRRLSRSQKLMPHSMLASVIGWNYFGYPVWASGLARRLAHLDRPLAPEW